MSDADLRARIAALWILQGRSCAELLRAHGRAQHAGNLVAAFDEVTEILAQSVGRDRLTEALDLATDELWHTDTAKTLRN